jgi:hypothetical protein
MAQRRKPSSSSATPTLVFMHVPKCGGVSFIQALSRSTNAKTVCGGLGDILFGTFDNFDLLDEKIRQSIYVNDRPAGASSDLVAGHFALSALKEWCPRGRFLTIMREPRIRLISHYLYWRTQSDIALRAWGPWQERVRLAQRRLGGLLRSPGVACQTDNLFLRFLLHPHRDIPPGDFIPESRHPRLYQEALTRLGEFDFIDVLENPRMPRNVGKWLGADFHLAVENRTVVRSDLPVSLADELDPATLKLLWSRSAVDRRLWLHTARRVRGFADASAEAERMFVEYMLRYCAKDVVRSPRLT